MRGESLCVVRADAAAEQEGRVAIVGREDTPVELLAIATDALTFRVEEEEISETSVRGGLEEVFRSRDVEGLDKLGGGCSTAACGTGSAKGAEVVGGFRAVELDVVEGVVFSETADCLDGLIDELFRQATELFE